jgi:hypothetical protein
MRISTFFIRLFQDLLAAAGPDVLRDKAALFLRELEAEPQAVIRQNPALRNATPFIKKHIDYLCRDYHLVKDAATAVVPGPRLPFEIGSIGKMRAVEAKHDGC